MGLSVASSQAGMRQGLLVVSLGFAVIGLVAAVWSHTRLKASRAERWSARGSVLLSTGMVIGMAPRLLFPNSDAVSIVASFVSIVFTAGSFVMMRHSRREIRARNAQEARR
jgi:hypothetical protein